MASSESRAFTMSVKIPHVGAIAASALKSAYLAIFSLLGPRGGYTYVQGKAVAPVRRRITEPLGDDAVGEYVIDVPDDASSDDIMLVSDPLSCWALRIARQLVFLPLTDDDSISQPLRALRESSGGKRLSISGFASWAFCTFGTLGTVPVHLAGADTVDSLIGREIRGKLPNGCPLEGTCIRHAGESATLLCRRSRLP